ncbi:MAG TPA: LacI family DNA-binding transcriptional regulator [Bryobacteraceae bacterium]|jgi:LacI family transcriptional regulator/LacI family repressor for deo operon, udp, cdd, tsx, nupC, and nupG
MVSIKDIARAAQVSHSTVSRALRNSPLVNIETRALIHKLAGEAGYTVSAVGRSLVTKRTSTIGVVVTTIADPFAGEVVSGIEEFALSHDYSVILAACHADPDRELRAVHSLQERRVDGILVMASRIGALYLPRLSGMKVPIVLINSHHPGEFVYSIRIDNVDGARLATKHLVDLGHRRIAYIGDRFGFQSDMERLTGYREMLEETNPGFEADLGFEPDLVAYGDGTPEGGRQAMLQLLSRAARPTAVFCYNDRMAIGAMRAVREQGLRVPRDVSIAGFDDLFLSSYTDPPLTTVRQPKRDMGVQAGEILLQLLAGEKPESRVTSGVLVVRESTGPPRSAASLRSAIRSHG